MTALKNFSSLLFKTFFPKKYSIAALNSAQFLGVVNDNLFKLVLVFLLIEAQGAAKANTILSLAGAIFVIPFLLFSSLAGLLADRFSKQKILRTVKAVEIVVFLLAFIAFAYKSYWGGYTLLFLISTLAALFGPSKYGIIPELVPSSAVPKSNGLITSFTYLGIIIGTFLASFVTEITNHNFFLVATFALFITLLGFISSLGVQQTPPQGSTKKVNPYFIQEIFHTIVFCKTIPHLLLAVAGSSYFLFIGAFAQLNIIPFAIESLHLSEIAGGYLFLATAFGIALGSFIAGKCAKNGVHLALPVLSGFVISLLLFALYIFSFSLTMTVLFLSLLGVCGGLFIVPFDSFIQLSSPQERRGQVIATANFLGFTGVLVASFALYLFGNVLHVSSATGFALIGLFTLFFAIFLLFRLSNFFLHFLSKQLLMPWNKTEILGLSLFAEEKNLPLVFCSPNYKELFLLCSLSPHLHIYTPRREEQSGELVAGALLHSLHLLPADSTSKSFVDSYIKESKTEQRALYWERTEEPSASSPYLLITLEKDEMGRCKRLILTKR